jgi:hypothetical protein
MDLASRIGANPAKAISRSNVSFLGKGPTKNPLFQSRLAGLENASAENLGDPKRLFGAIDDAVGWAKDGKLNSIQTEILGHNLSGIAKIVDPPPLPTLPMASVTAIRPGIEGLRRFPKESHKFFGRPLKDKDFSEIDRMVMEGKLPDARGRTWNLGAQETGIGNITKALDAKTGMSRAIARQLLQQDTRLKLTPEELFMLREGKGEPLDLMRKYYGRSMTNYDDFMDEVFASGDMVDAASLKAWNPKDVATRILSDIELVPQFAEGGLAEILQAPKMKHGGRIGFFKGAQADTAEGKAMSPGTTASGGHRTGGEGPVITTENVIKSPIIDTRSPDYNFNLGESGISPSFNVKYSPNRKMNILARISNQNLLESDDIDLQGNLYGAAGNFNYEVPFTDEGIQGVNLDYDNFSANIDPNKNYNVGYNKNIEGWNTGVNYDSDGNLMATIGTKFNKGGLARILEV